LNNSVSVDEEYKRATAKSLIGLDSLYRYVAPESGDVNLSVARRLANVDWTVFAVVPERVVLANLGSLVQRTAIASVAVVALALMLGWLFTERISMPLRKVSTAADTLARGNMTARVEVMTRDEFGQLGTTFNRMADAIASNNETLEGRVR